ncbi:MAG: hypothetical protein JNN05_04805, partial [Candidatus Omnitrophica bacterium]|nr:hypothetical protein [Candidatus Omnitrophota bacterium]
MAKGYLNIEVTPQRIRYILMQSSGRGYEVLKSGSVGHTLNTLVAGDLTRVIKEILVKENIAPKRLFVSVCRPGTLIRQITMPRMKKQEMDEAISSEIEKLPFFANNLYDYIYTANKTAKEKLNVILAAIDQNTLNYVIEDVRKLRIPFEHLEITPLNIKDVVPYKKTDNPNQMVLIVHDQMSYLMMLNIREYRFVYQSSTGMQHLCPSGNGNIVEAVFNNFAGELQRVIKSYMAEQKLENSPKLWLIWDSQSGSKLQEMITEKLGMDCTSLSFDHL